MSKTTMGIRIISSAKERSMKLPTQHIPPRSRLYGLTPCEKDTLWRESLTSYINRLGWAHGVAPQRLLLQEICPFMSISWLRTAPNGVSEFSRTSGVMHANGTQTLAVETSMRLEQLTMQSDLHLLTLRWWIGDLPLHRNLRQNPAWCPFCYAEWKAHNLVLYQPLFWMLQAMTWCPRHTTPLIDRCPHCHKVQSLIFRDNARIGECTQCAGWLGANALEGVPRETQEEANNWQTWVISTLEELRATSLSSSIFHWKTFFTQLALNMKRPGATHLSLAQLTGIKRGNLYRWTGHEITPTLEMILYFCYRCRVTPVQIMTGPPETLQRAIQQEVPNVLSHTRRKVYQHLDKQRCREFIQRVLDGREDPLCLSHVAKHLGCSDTLLKSHFPHECAMIVHNFREYEKQQKELKLQRQREAVRQAVLALHAQGVSPSYSRVARFLSNPFFMSTAEARASWSAALSELELES